MGGGAVVEDEERPGRDYHFRRSWVRDKLRAAPSMLRVLQVEGDSMLPTLEDGDTVLVEMNQRSPNSARDSSSWTTGWAWLPSGSSMSR